MSETALAPLSCIIPILISDCPLSERQAIKKKRENRNLKLHIGV
jgi:hypothetical protein